MRYKKGQTMPLAILSALAVFIVGFTLINFLMPEVTTFRVDMGCADASTLNDGAKLLCLIGDATIPYVLLSVFSLAVGLIIARMRL